jgi:hypothetical protein
MVIEVDNVAVATVHVPQGIDISSVKTVIVLFYKRSIDIHLIHRLFPLPWVNTIEAFITARTRQHVSAMKQVL